MGLIVWLLNLPLAVLRGFTASKLWAWFVITTFPSVPRIGVVQAIGLTLVLGAFRDGYSAQLTRKLCVTCRTSRSALPRCSRPP